jgi:DNA-binding LytR/AlgR family response regulator
MKIKTIINPLIEERIEIYSKEYNNLIKQIEELIRNYKNHLIGYFEDEIVPLKFDEVYRFFIEDKKIFASTKDKKYLIKLRLYQIEELVNSSFIKINQSCLVNKNKIKKFSSSWGGTILVELKNGDKEYISRRQTKTVLERMGIK